MMSNPWIAMSVLCMGAFASLPYPMDSHLASQAEAVLERLDAHRAAPTDDTGIARLQDLSGTLNGPRSVQWSAQAPDEEDMASLHAQSTDSLLGMSWTLPKGIQALHLREGQAQIIEEADHWRVVAGPGRRLAVHWQQRRS